MWRDGMRDCDFCKDRNIPPQAKQHADDKCTFASKEQIDALLKARAERRKAKQERYDTRLAERREAKQERYDTKKKGKNGNARLAQSSIDDDEVASGRFFGGDQSALILRPRDATAFRVRRHAHLLLALQGSARLRGFLCPAQCWRKHFCQPVLVHPRDA